jgi:alginate O-acetyltransferase complex protein AlgI
MTICGIWHGARWTFIIWGVIHSLYLIIGFLTKKVKRKALKRYNISNKNQLLELSRIVITFILITTAFVFFRSENIETAFLMFTSILSFNFSTGSMLFYNVNDLYFSFASILFLLAVEYIQYKKDNGTFQYQIKDMLSIPFLILLILLIIYFGKFGESDFIYFKF